MPSLHTSNPILSSTSNSEASLSSPNQTLKELILAYQSHLHQTLLKIKAENSGELEILNPLFQHYTKRLAILDKIYEQIQLQKSPDYLAIIEQILILHNNEPEAIELEFIAKIRQAVSALAPQAEMLVVLLHTCKQQGFLAQGYKFLQTPFGKEYRLNCDVLFIATEHSRQVYVIEKMLGKGKYGAVYKIKPEYYCLTEGKIATERTQLTAMKVVDYQQMLSNITLFGNVLAQMSEAKKWVASQNKVPFAQGAILRNEADMGTKYFSRLVPGYMINLYPINEREIPKGVVLQQPYFAGEALNDYLGYGHLDYAKLPTVDKIIEYREKNVPAKRVHKLKEWQAAINQDNLPHELLALVGSLTEQMRVLSKAEMIHGDLFLDNIQVISAQEVVLLDFAFALSATGKGTMHKCWPAFNAPEVKYDKIEISALQAAQMYSFGVILQLILGLKDQQLKVLQHKGQLSQVGQLADLILRMKSKSPSARPSLTEVESVFASISQAKQIGNSSTANQSVLAISSP